MATRVNRKNVTCTPPKEIAAVEKDDVAAEAAVPRAAGAIRKLTKKSQPKKLLKKGIGIKLKAKSKKPTNKLKKIVKTLENRKKLLKTGAKEAAKAGKRKVSKKEKDDSPPVLEPIFPLDDNVEKRRPKKRGPKPGNKTIHTGSGDVKIENDDSLSVASDVTDASNEIPTLSKQVRKPRTVKRIKTDPDTLEDVMNDLSFLIKGEDVKKEQDSLSESGRSDITVSKTKKLTKKQRLELLRKEIIKKENIENSLSKSDEKVIDMLDLNVRNLKKKSPVTKRRHSIEKFPINTESEENPLSIFAHLPRSISPRSKRAAKARQSIDGAPKRASPYPSRSDSPARLLRNGKQRKLKDAQLFEGLLDAEARKRRRLCSDLSGSEISVSKFSGYESDSSFSDMASLHGAEINDTKKEIFEDEENKTTVIKNIISESVTNEPPVLGLIDTNSNLCENLNSLNDEIKKESDGDLCKKEPVLYAFNDSAKVPEKSIILDIMKQTFNDEKMAIVKNPPKENFEGDAVVPARLYGHTAINAVDVLKEVDDDMPPTLEPNLPIGELPEAAVVPEGTNTDASIEESLTGVLVDGSEAKDTDTPPDISIEENLTWSKVNSEETQTNGQKHEREKAIIKDDNKMNAEEINLESCEQLSKEKDKIEELLLNKEEQVVQIETSTFEDLEKNEGKSNDLPESIDEIYENYEDLQKVKETPEEIEKKENILKALGLQSLRAAKEAKQKSREKPAAKADSYTGTLKTVIKINRDKKKGRNSFKMTLQDGRKNKSKSGFEGDVAANEEIYKISKEGASSSVWKHGNQSSDTAGANRKSHYSNRSNMDGSSEHTSDGEAASQDGAIKALVIPEKASSFSIHPDRLCKDECSYCFGKFGLFDTPCHIAQMKSVDRQKKILATEKHLTTESCLCDACYRHVDRKSNTPSYTNKSMKRNSLVAPGPRQNHCHVLGCSRVSANILRRKWIIKMRKSICQVINIDLDNPGLHSIPICDEHYSALEHLMVCAMCKRRLARNHIHYLGPETNDLNDALQAEGVPLALTDKPVVCKLCKCFASVVLKDPEERPESSSNFFREYKKRLLHFNDIVPMDEAAAEEPIAFPGRSERNGDQQPRKKKKLGRYLEVGDHHRSMDGHDSSDNAGGGQERLPSTDTSSQPRSRSESPMDEYNGVDYNTLIPAIAMDCGSDTEIKKEAPKKQPIIIRKLNKNMKDSVEILKISKSNLEKMKGADVAVQRLGSNPSISVRQLFPGEEDLPLNASVEFNSVKERTPEGWEKCASIIQFDAETKRLWHELQKPYGNQSSFLRHLILLEKYFRNGDLVLSPNATHHSVNYGESVHNRLRAYDNISSHAGNVQPISMLPFNKMHRSSSGIITSIPAAATSNGSALVPAQTQKSAPLTLSQLNSPPLIPANPVVLQQVRPKLSAPPGLISLHPGTGWPVAPLIKVPQSQKIKFPITKNWRPNLIPIDPTKKPERKAGLVQVISGGKPYHITLEDYKKMCAIKRSFEMKQKRIQEAAMAAVNSKAPVSVNQTSVLKSLSPRKGLTILKTPTAAASQGKTGLAAGGENSEIAGNILEKLDRQVEKLESKLNEKPSLLLPKIPRSLTVIPQTVTRKSSRPSSPVLLITPKSSATKS